MVIRKKWIAAACCLLISAASVYGLWRELSPFLAKPIEQAVAPDTYGDEAFRLGLSSYSRTLVMKDCFRIILAYSDIDMVDEAARGIVSTCADRAGEIVAASPSNAFAWLTRAAASARLLRMEDFDLALRNSQLTGPNEQWIARYRVNLAETYFAQLSPAARKAEEADLRLLASSERGVKLIAQRYITDPDFRARISAVVETMPGERQAAFLRSVKKAMAKG